MKRIRVTVKGGIVQAVVGTPKGVEVMIRDYDVDGANPDEDPSMKLDKDGRWCREYVESADGCLMASEA